MHLKNLATAGAVTVAFSLTACSAPSTDGSTSPTTSPSAIGTPSAPPGPSASASESGAEAVVGTVVRFSAGAASVDVTIGEDTPAVRDFLSLLPLSLTLEEFNGREEIATLPRKLRHDGSPGSDPEDRDLIYYIPWGNIDQPLTLRGVPDADAPAPGERYYAATQRLVLYYGHVGRWAGLVRMGHFAHDLEALRDLPDGFTVEIAAIDADGHGEPGRSSSS